MTNPEEPYDLIVAGGGAAGFFAAIRAAEVAPGSRIAILEGSNQTLNKVRISGGGRRNVTHACWDPAELVTHYPRGQKELLGPFHTFAPGDTVEWFASRGVETKIEEDGRMFPVTNRSESIAGCLEDSARQAGVEVILRQRVRTISRRSERFFLGTASGQSFETRYLMVATGSQPAMWEVLAGMGHRIISPVPSLFTFHINSKGLHKLSGVSVPNAGIQAEGRPFQSFGPQLITHQGLSGPAVLRLSAYGARDFFSRDYHAQLRVDWLGSGKEAGMIAIREYRTNSGARLVAGKGQVDVPHRLWLWMVARSGIQPEAHWADLTREQMDRLAENLSDCPLQMIGKSTFKEEFVTAGGVDLAEIDFRRFESKAVPGLFLAGEVLNIDAVTGGFNFQAAWTGGWMAGSELGKRMIEKREGQ